MGAASRAFPAIIQARNRRHRRWRSLARLSWDPERFPVQFPLVPRYSHLHNSPTNFCPRKKGAQARTGRQGQGAWTCCSLVRLLSGLARAKTFAHDAKTNRGVTRSCVTPLYPQSASVRDSAYPPRHCGVILPIPARNQGAIRTAHGLQTTESPQARRSPRRTRTPLIPTLPPPKHAVTVRPNPW